MGQRFSGSICGQVDFNKKRVGPEFLIALVVFVVGYVAIVHVGMFLLRLLFRLPRGRDGSFFARRIEDRYGGQTPSMEERRVLSRRGQRR